MIEATPVFTRAAAWLGGCYELALELGPRDDARLARALKAVWSHSDLDGCFLNRGREPDEQRRIDMTGSAIPVETCLRGVARVGPARPLACSTIPVREDGGSDWIHFGIPIGSLGYVYPVGSFPFPDEGDPSWRAHIDDWLCSLACRVYQDVDFCLGLVGWTEGTVQSAAELGRNGVPEERWCGYLVAEDRRLRWSPPNRAVPGCS